MDICIDKVSNDTKSGIIAHVLEKYSIFSKVSNFLIVEHLGFEN